jgi:hypothetical protein
MQDQGRLAQPAQPGQAAPARTSEQLIGISQSTRRLDVAHEFLQPLGVLAVGAPIEIGSDPAHVVRVEIAPRGSELGKGRELPRYHDGARRRGGENEPSTACWERARELLCHCTAPRNTEHIQSPVIAEPRHQVVAKARNT